MLIYKDYKQYLGRICLRKMDDLQKYVLFDLFYNDRVGSKNIQNSLLLVLT